VGADKNDDGANLAGAAYIFFGSSTLSGTKSLGGVDSADVTILGKAASDYVGRIVSGAGDVNGDGFDDIVVGARGNDDAASLAGAAYIIFGASNLSGTKSLGQGQSADVTFLGKVGSDNFGIGTSGAGDVNDDGFDDIIVGAYRNDDCAAGTGCGAAYIFFGASDLSGTKALGQGQSADVTFLGKGNADLFGYSVSGVGDVNADGIADIIVGAQYNDDGTGSNGGAAYIFFGATNLIGTKDTANSDEDVRILGKANIDHLGRSVGGGRSNPGP